MDMISDPETYKHTPIEKFTLNKDIEDIFLQWDNLVEEHELEVLKKFVMELYQVADKLTSNEVYEKEMIRIRRQLKVVPKKAKLMHVYLLLVAKGEIAESESFRRCFVSKATKSQSGVLVITVLTSPYPVTEGKVQQFSCEWDCFYCPNEPGQPRSYLHDEPSVLRANRNSFDPVLQFCDRAVTLAMNGHPIDKVELLILGGTWASYPKDYQENFIRDLFYAANTFMPYPRDPKDVKLRKRSELMREKKSLEEEKRINETTSCKIIGITLETRPDCITREEILNFRRYGCTRVQLGVQHTDDGVLKKINRACTTAQVKHALKMLKDSCYKIDLHLMPNLPGSSPQMDRDMFDEVLNDPDLQADQWKIYPCEITPWTKIHKWFTEGKYVPYGEEELLEVLIYAKAKVHPWIRLNRVVRDIPSQYILGGVNNPSMRNDALAEMHRRGLTCPCIRCREVKGELGEVGDPRNAQLMVRKYRASEGDEYFISIEGPIQKTGRIVILGFCRLRIVDWELHGKRLEQERNQNRERERNEELEEEKMRSSSKRSSFVRSKSPMERSKPCIALPELFGHALVRELHVYGQMVTTEEKKKEAQHTGLGTRLMREAEKIALEKHGITKISVISGVGARGFYRKIGYHGPVGEGEMMEIDLSSRLRFQTFLRIVKILLLVIFVLGYGIIFQKKMTNL